MAEEMVMHVHLPTLTQVSFHCIVDSTSLLTPIISLETPERIRKVQSPPFLVQATKTQIID